ncbi:hypothetical protein BAST_1027 [Bifidobacterium asteroides PRL2011]|nr:hypothetical protein BAST_1027 [Bifidobacterium asteroides PRL2011]
MLLEDPSSFFDTANVYPHGNTERYLGQGLKKYAK